MLINNKEYSTRVRFLFMMLILAYLVVIVVFAAFVTWEYNPLFLISLSAVLLFSLILFFLRGYNYIYFSADGSKIILRYMQLQPFLFESNSIEIPKHQFVKYEIVKKNFGLKTGLVLYLNTDRGLSKFPAVSLASLKNSEKRDMLEALDRLSL